MTIRQTLATDDLRGKRVLVTGGTKGAGEAIVRRLAAAGARVATTARSPDAGSPAELFVQADVATLDGAAKVAAATIDGLGGIDIVIHSVGGSKARAADLRRCPTGSGRMNSTSICLRR